MPSLELYVLEHDELPYHLWVEIYRFWLLRILIGKLDLKLGMCDLEELLRREQYIWEVDRRMTVEMINALSCGLYCAIKAYDLFVLILLLRTLGFYIFLRWFEIRLHIIR